eukprot:Cvel_8795.t1-p1 / transcript=Cvel_8795.t1 / gene=Cvel_8795 / organism=Chromera_velia_CCMP2878 / gene_product=Fibrillin-1, putative / transcript_product=Fibrillin-1, putative / location=Cvel_scaffold492:67487-84038(+) / protein_length=1954 / sequence_SO=supercontig / SO=protein_coding / is_pseudo=false
MVPKLSGTGARSVLFFIFLAPLCVDGTTVNIPGWGSGNEGISWKWTGNSPVVAPCCGIIVDMYLEKTSTSNNNCLGNFNALSNKAVGTGSSVAAFADGREGFVSGGTPVGYLSQDAVLSGSDDDHFIALVAPCKFILEEFTWRNTNNGNVNRSPGTLEVSGSNDLQTWVSLFSQSGITWTSNPQTKTFTLSPTPSTQYRAYMFNTKRIAHTSDIQLEVGEVVLKATTASVAQPDECATNVHDCDTNAACNNTVGSFECACNDGYSGTGIAPDCADENECTLNTHDCDTNAGCTDSVGSFSCSCNAGYSGSGVSCSDDDECTLTNDDCDTNAGCTNTVGSFTCACNAGYSGSGVSCSDSDECTLNTHDCATLGACTNSVGSFTCACNAGASGSGVVCSGLSGRVGEVCAEDGSSTASDIETNYATEIAKIQQWQTDNQGVSGATEQVADTIGSTMPPGTSTTYEQDRVRIAIRVESSDAETIRAQTRTSSLELDLNRAASNSASGPNVRRYVDGVWRVHRMSMPQDARPKSSTEPRAMSLTETMISPSPFAGSRTREGGFVLAGLTPFILMSARQGNRVIGGGRVRVISLQPKTPRSEGGRSSRLLTSELRENEETEEGLRVLQGEATEASPLATVQMTAGSEMGRQVLEQRELIEANWEGYNLGRAGGTWEIECAQLDVQNEQWTTLGGASEGKITEDQVLCECELRALQAAFIMSQREKTRLPPIEAAALSTSLLDFRGKNSQRLSARQIRKAERNLPSGSPQIMKRPSERKLLEQPIDAETRLLLAARAVYATEGHSRRLRKHLNPRRIVGFHLSRGAVLDPSGRILSKGTFKDNREEDRKKRRMCNKCTCPSHFGRWLARVCGRERTLAFLDSRIIRRALKSQRRAEKQTIGMFEEGKEKEQQISLWQGLGVQLEGQLYEVGVRLSFEEVKARMHARRRKYRSTVFQIREGGGLCIDPWGDPSRQVTFTTSKTTDDDSDVSDNELLFAEDRVEEVQWDNESKHENEDEKGEEEEEAEAGAETSALSEARQILPHLQELCNQGPLQSLSAEQWEETEQAFMRLEETSRSLAERVAAQEDNPDSPLENPPEDSHLHTPAYYRSPTHSDSRAGHAEVVVQMPSRSGSFQKGGGQAEQSDDLATLEGARVYSDSKRLYKRNSADFTPDASPFRPSMQDSAFPFSSTLSHHSFNAKGSENDERELPDTVEEPPVMTERDGPYSAEAPRASTSAQENANNRRESLPLSNGGRQEGKRESEGGELLREDSRDTEMHVAASAANLAEMERSLAMLQPTQEGEFAGGDRAERDSIDQAREEEKERTLPVEAASSESSGDSDRHITASAANIAEFAKSLGMLQGREPEEYREEEEEANEERERGEGSRTPKAESDRSAASGSRSSGDSDRHVTASAANMVEFEKALGMLQGLQQPEDYRAGEEVQGETQMVEQDREIQSQTRRESAQREAEDVQIGGENDVRETDNLILDSIANLTQFQESLALLYNREGEHQHQQQHQAFRDEYETAGELQNPRHSSKVQFLGSHTHSLEGLGRRSTRATRGGGDSLVGRRGGKSVGMGVRFEFVRDQVASTLQNLHAAGCGTIVKRWRKPMGIVAPVDAQREGTLPLRRSTLRSMLFVRLWRIHLICEVTDVSMLTETLLFACQILFSLCLVLVLCITTVLMGETDERHQARRPVEVTMAPEGFSLEGYSDLESFAPAAAVKTLIAYLTVQILSALFVSPVLSSNWAAENTCGRVDLEDLIWKSHRDGTGATGSVERKTEKPFDSPLCGRDANPKGSLTTASEVACGSGADRCSFLEDLPVAAVPEEQTTQQEEEKVELNGKSDDESATTTWRALCYFQFSHGLSMETERAWAPRVRSAAVYLRALYFEILCQRVLLACLCVFLLWLFAVFVAIGASSTALGQRHKQVVLREYVLCNLWLFTLVLGAPAFLGALQGIVA